MNRASSTLSPRVRTLLHQALHGAHGKCRTTALTGLINRGWLHGPAGGYQLTTEGRRVAEFCETFPEGAPVDLSLMEELAS
jgi:hypothetical protein